MLSFHLTLVLSEDPELPVQDSPPAPVVVRSLSTGGTTVKYSNHTAGKPLSSVLCPLSSVLCPLSSVLCTLSSVLCPQVCAARSSSPCQPTPPVLQLSPQPSPKAKSILKPSVDREGEKKKRVRMLFPEDTMTNI